MANKLNEKVEYNIIQHGGGFGSIILNDEETLSIKQLMFFIHGVGRKGHQIYLVKVYHLVPCI